MKRPQGRHVQIGIRSGGGSAYPPRRFAELKTKARPDVPAKKRCAWILVLLLILSAISFVLLMVFLEVFNPEGNVELSSFLIRGHSTEPTAENMDMPSTAATSYAAKISKVSGKSRTSKVSEKSTPRESDNSTRHYPELGQDGTPTVAILSYHDYAVEKEGAKVRGPLGVGHEQIMHDVCHCR